MPIYEYECQACGYRHEAIQKMSDDPLKDCPECGKAELKKLISAAAFRLKGGGWYETDFKSGQKKNLEGGDKGPSEKGSSEKASGNKAATDSKSSAAGGGTAKSTSTKSTSNSGSTGGGSAGKKSG